MTIKEFLSPVISKANNLERVTIAARSYEALKQGNFDRENPKKTLYMNETSEFIDNFGHMDVLALEFYDKEIFLEF